MNYSHYNKILIVLFLFSLGTTFAQNWKNPAEKYLNSYKAYQNAQCPIQNDSIKHFVYFSRNRHEIKGHPVINYKVFEGAHIMYSWEQLEPKKGEYNFSLIEEDIKYLKRYKKKLFIQLQDMTFDIDYKPIPKYLTTNEYSEGAVLHYENKNPEGWLAKRWNNNVQKRFALLLQALGTCFDGKIEGINLQETAINIKNELAFSEEKYFKALKKNMLALKRAFPNTTTMIYANFFPGEWLPWDDKGYLKGIYAYGEEIGVGLGNPDLMVRRKAQLNHALAQMHENDFTVPIGIAIQDGNYIGKTSADIDYDEYSDIGESRINIVPMLYSFAKNFLKVDYMFWGYQEPYFTEDVLPCFKVDN